MSGTNPLSQSDEDFLNSAPPPVDDTTGGEDAGASDDDKAAHDAGDPDPEEQTDADLDTGNANDDGDDDASGDGHDPAEGDQKQAADGGKDKPTEGEAEPEGDKPAGNKKENDGDAQPGVDRVFQVPTEFKANGKTVKLKDEAEALKLMQMGANYTKQMQQLAPHRKVLMMLQDNSIDESKLSFLIDLDRKDPEAIKKLVKDAGIDPLEMDLQADSNYFAGSHTVTDEEAGFRTAVEDLGSTPYGKETIALVNSNWDDASKEVIFKQPEILSVIHEQREAGIYDTITAEMDRQIAVGKIAPNTPFLTAYKQVGDELVAATTGQAPASGQQGNGGSDGQPGVAPGAKPTPVTTRAAAPKDTLKNGDKAGAAAPSRSSPGSAKPAINPLAMSDDQFLKSMENRL